MAKIKKPARLSGQDRREDILRAARAIFIRDNFAGARIKAIAEEAGITDALIYQHFDSKVELFEAAVVEPLDRWIHEHEHIAPSLKSASDDVRVKLMQGTITRYLEEVFAMLPLLGAALTQPDGRGGDFYVRRISPILSYWSTWNELAFDPNSKGAHIDAEFMTKAGFGIGVFLMMDAFYSGKEPDFAKVSKQLAEFLLPFHELVASAEEVGGKMEESVSARGVVGGRRILPPRG